MNSQKTNWDLIGHPAAVIALMGLVFQLSLVLFLGYRFDQLIPRWVPDDACYYFKISQNICSGLGSVFSPHEPTNGYHPLWMTLLVAIQFIGHPAMPVFIIEVLCVAVVCNVMGAGLLYALLKSVGFNNGQASCGIAIYLFSPWTVCLTLTGLETPLYLACLFWFLLAVTRAESPDTSLSLAMVISFGLSAGFMMLARTDAVFFAVIGFLWVLYRRKGSSVAVIFLMEAGMLTVLVLAPWLTWNLLTFGTFVQGSADAMSGYLHSELPAGMGGSALWVWERLCGRLYWAVMAPLAFHRTYESIIRFSNGFMAALMTGFVVWLIYQRCGRQRWICPVVLWLPTALLMILYFGIRLHVQAWHLAPLFVLVLVLILNGVEGGKRYAWLAIMTGLFPLALYSAQQGYFSPQDGGIQRAQELYRDALVRLKVGATDAGYLGCFSRHEIVNLDGIVNQNANMAIRAGRFSDYLAGIHCHEVFMHEYRLKYYDRNMPYRISPESVNLAHGRVLAETHNIALPGRFPYQERVVGLPNGLVPGRLHMIEIRYHTKGDARPFVIVTVDGRPPVIHDPLLAAAEHSTVSLPLVVLQKTPKAEFILRNWSDKGRVEIEMARLIEVR